MNHHSPSAEVPDRGAEVDEAAWEDLPAPPKARRLAAMTVMALTVVASLALMATLRSDLGYYFSEPTATDLGDVGAVDPADLSPNTFVRVSGTPMASGTVHYRRVLFGGTYAVFPLAGQRNVFVQVPVDGPEAERLMSRREFSGRLVTFGSLGGRFGEVRRYLDDTMAMPVSSESFLLLADEPPGSYGWVLFLMGLCVLFVAINGWLMVRWFRPVKPLREAAPEAASAD